METLLLFDIDGTLVQGASSAHAEALRTALSVVHEIDLERLRATPVPGTVAGRTDGEIARLLLLEAGVSATRIDERADAVRAECCRLYAELCPSDLSDTVVEGMPELLGWLAERDDARLSLVTGNFEAIARIKLQRAGIGHWFGTGEGGFGSDSEDRSMLPPIARRRSGHLTGLQRSWPRDRTMVIGDTPRDIACAHADEVRCVAVTTGPYQAEALARADVVATSTDRLREAFAELL